MGDITWSERVFLALIAAGEATVSADNPAPMADEDLAKRALRLAATFRRVRWEPDQG